MSAQDRYAKKTLKSFRSLAKSLRTIKGESSYIKRTLKKHKKVISFLDNEIGTQEGNKSVRLTRGAVLRLLFRYVTKDNSLKEIIEKAEPLFARHYENKRLIRAQRPLLDTIPTELLSFLPPKIVVRVDDDGYIQDITDMFDNESHNLSAKIKAQREILKRRNEIMAKVYKDLSSRDSWVRDSALVTAIIIETGIRPGNRANGLKDGAKTFGAVTLKGKHLNFGRGKVDITFKGKKGTLNKATISTPEIIKALRDRVEKGLGDLFPDYDYDDLNKYFSANFSELNITDFRKLKATEEVFESLLRERDHLYKRIRDYVRDEAEISKERVISELTRVFNLAHESAQIALSHESSTTTKKSYINPQVLLGFLSSGGMIDSLEDCILKGKTRLSFDPQSFISKATKTANVGFYAEQTMPITLNHVMEKIR